MAVYSAWKEKEIQGRRQGKRGEADCQAKWEVENYFPTMSTSNFGKSAFAKALLVAISLILNRRFVEEIESTVIR